MGTEIAHQHLIFVKCTAKIDLSADCQLQRTGRRLVVLDTRVETSGLTSQIATSTEAMPSQHLSSANSHCLDWYFASQNNIIISLPSCSANGHLSPMSSLDLAVSIGARRKRYGTLLSAQKDLTSGFPKVKKQGFRSQAAAPPRDLNTAEPAK